jgi:hypothetical protein
MVESGEQPRRLDVSLGAVLDRGCHEIKLRHHLLLRGVHGRHLPVQQIEACAELVDGGLRGYLGLPHRVEDELRLR